MYNIISIYVYILKMYRMVIIVNRTILCIWKLMGEKHFFIDISLFFKKRGICSSLYLKVSFSSVQSLSPVRLFVTPWITARQASLSITNSQSSPRLTSIESLGLQLRSVSYWRSLTAQSTDDCHLLSTVKCLSRILGRRSGWCCESQRGLNWSRSGWVAHLITLLLLVVFLWNALWRAFGAVMRKGTRAGNNIQLGSDGRGFLEL